MIVDTNIFKIFNDIKTIIIVIQFLYNISKQHIKNYSQIVLGITIVDYCGVFSQVLIS